MRAEDAEDLPDTVAETPEAKAQALSLGDAPRCIGPYVLRRVLGEGGMGTVFLADQFDPIRREVALKLVRFSGPGAERLLERFALERQVVALMRHPHIAQLFDAGITEDGRPYFVMEYVDGEPITAYCDARKLSIVERLRLFLEVCAALQHAHQKGVIHRDIKPRNVLVSTIEGRPSPKVIDFGLAKVLSGELSGLGGHTQADAVLGTFGYMSPEQFDRSLLPEPDTRSDVYGLGLLLFELLAGSPAYASSSDLGRVLSQLSSEPEKLSSRIARTAAAVAPERRSSPAELIRLLSGDLEWIVQKALERNPADRYPAVSELAADIERHLSDRAVLVGPPTFAYRARKFIRRNRLPVISAALIVCSLCAGAVATVAALLRSREAEARATAEAAKVKATNEFLTDMLASADPSGSGREIRVVDVLARASADLPERYRDQPDVEAALRLTLGNTYHSLGRLEQAEIELRQARELLERTLGPSDERTLLAISGYADILDSLGRYQEAAQLTEKAIDEARQQLGDEAETTLNLRTIAAWAIFQLGRVEEAEGIVHEVWQLRSRRPGRATISSGGVLAWVLDQGGKTAPARAVYAELVPLARRELGPRHPDTLTILNNYALFLTNQKEYGEARQLFDELIAAQLVVRGADHFETLTSRHNLAVLLRNAGELPAAESMMLDVLAARQRILGEDHPHTLASRRALSAILIDAGRSEEARGILFDVYRRALSRFEPGSEDIQNSQAALRRFFTKTGEKVPPWLENGEPPPRQP